MLPQTLQRRLHVCVRVCAHYIILEYYPFTSIAVFRGRPAEPLPASLHACDAITKPADRRVCRQQEALPLYHWKARLRARVRHAATFGMSS